MKLTLIIVSALLILAGVAWFIFARSGSSNPTLQATGFGAIRDKNKGAASGADSLGSPAIIPKNAPVVTSFTGDLLNKGNPQGDGTLSPFVVGETLKLEAEALNAVEYRWTVNGEILKEKGQEWTALPYRFFDVARPGDLTFAVQVRGADPALVSQEKRETLNILPLKIIRLSKAIIHADDDHYLTGENLNLEVEMATAMTADLEFYKYRYLVNDVPIKHPEDGEEWTPNSTLTYTFATPGVYSFKVEARRATETHSEDSAELPDTIVAADAVLLNFDANPSQERGAAAGASVYLSAFPVSRYGKSESRIGVKKINAAEFNWLKEDTGATWGDPYRTWVPIDPGTYLVRCEIREIGKESSDDQRELVFTVTEGNF